MEQADQFNNVEENPSYWGSVGIAALIFALINFVLGTIFGYLYINESVGGLGSSISGGIICLIAAFGGMLAVWHYSKENDLTMSLGKGALIGLWTGIGVFIISFILTHIWLLIDPSFDDKILQVKMMSMSEAQREAVAKAKGMMGTMKIVGQAVQLVIFAVLNLLTGLLGVQLFAKEEEDF